MLKTLLIDGLYAGFCDWVRFVLLASGLGLGSTRADSMLSLQLLIDMITGQLGDQGEQSGAATISRVLLAGNLLSQSTQDKEASTKVCCSPGCRLWCGEV